MRNGPLNAPTPHLRGLLLMLTGSASPWQNEDRLDRCESVANVSGLSPVLEALSPSLSLTILEELVRDFILPG